MTEKLTQLTQTRIREDVQSMQAYAVAHEFEQDPVNSKISQDIILDPFAYIFPMGRENLQ